MRVAALDLGSNTFLCLICEVVSTASTTAGQGPSSQKIRTIYSDQIEIVRLGQGLSTSKKFHPEALSRAKACLENFKKTIDTHRPDRILAMATSAARDAENQNELFKICKDLEIPLEIIPGHKEAEITYQGAISGQKTSDQKKLILDIGGGSTEFIFGQADHILNATSVNIGCVRLTEKYILNQPTTAADIQICRKFIIESLLQIPNHEPKQILAVAGTPTTLAAVELGAFLPEKIEGYELTLPQLEAWLQRLQPLSVQEKIQLGFPAGRADVILVGVLILIESLKNFNLTKIIISTRGVRHGVALEIADRN